MNTNHSASITLRDSSTLTIIASEHKLASLTSDDGLGISAACRSIKAAAALAAYAQSFGARAQVVGTIVSIYA